MKARAFVGLVASLVILNSPLAHAEDGLPLGFLDNPVILHVKVIGKPGGMVEAGEIINRTAPALQCFREDIHIKILEVLRYPGDSSNLPTYVSERSFALQMIKEVDGRDVFVSTRCQVFTEERNGCVVSRTKIIDDHRAVTQEGGEYIFSLFPPRWVDSTHPNTRNEWELRPEVPYVDATHNNLALVKKFLR